MTITIDLTDSETDTVTELRLLAFLATDADVVKLAIVRLAQQYDVAVRAGDFPLNVPRRRRALVLS